jgi:flagellin-like protein
MNIRKRKAISPLITTLLLIAIAVAASVLTYSWVMSMVGSQSAQAQTQIRIDTVAWNKAGSGQGFSIVIRNTGSVAATIESITVRLNTAGSSTQTFNPAVPKSIDVSVTWDSSTLTGLGWKQVGDPLVNNDPNANMSPKWVVSTSYVIRVTTTTGFYYETVSTTPASYT